MNIRSMASTTLLTATACLAFDSHAADSVSQAFSDGDASISFRYRVESVHQDGLDENALASTLKTRLNYRTGRFGVFDAFLEVDDVSYLGTDDFNSLRNGNTTYPVVADPDGTAINQVYLRATGETATFTFGRQRINHGGQRFVGGVGWRQNEQTYDAATITLTPESNWSATYSYIDRVMRIFGPDVGTPDRALESNSHIMNVRYATDDFGALTGYGYFLDFDDARGASSRTIGFAYDRTFAADGFKVPVSVAWATQDDYADNPNSYEVDYLLLEAGVTTEVFTAKAGIEVLEGSATAGFSTPLATLHKFQGWADKFLGTPAEGVEDRYLSFGTSFGKARAALVFHDFSSDVGSIDYGQELDASISLPLTSEVGMLLKVARYNADARSTDTTKLWLMLTARF